MISIIKFNPLVINYFKIPEGISIAVFSSLKESKKANSSNNFYNVRVAECRAGCALLLKNRNEKKPGAMCSDI